MRVSVIIPIYNTEKYLDKCLNSIKNQTFKDFEVIMVDDGSTDKSAEICKYFSNEDSRFKYFFKENGGSSSARNLGLRNAQGDYIAFIDSDDFIDLDYLNILINATESREYSIVQCGMKLIKGQVSSQLLPPSGEYLDTGYTELVLKRKLHIFLFQTTVSKLYNRELLKKHNIYFDEKVTVSEDSLFNTQLLPFISSAKFIQNSYYNYLQDNSTISRAVKSFEVIKQSIRVGIITSKIRFDLIQIGKYGDSEVLKGFQTAICIIYISNAREIESNNLSKEEKIELYNYYFSEMNYPINIAIKDFSGTDKRIALSSARKDYKTISRIYKLRKLKSKIKR